MGHGAAAEAVTSTRILEGAFDGASARERADAGREVILRTSLVAAALALEPVPLLDTAIVTPMQHRLMQSMARLHGVRLGGKEVADIFDTLSGSLFGPNATIAVAKLIVFVPVLPDLIGGTIAYALTSAVGGLGDALFTSKQKTSPSEMRARFRVIFWNEFRCAYKERRDELKAMFRSPEVRKELEQLKQAHRAGEIGPDELARRTSEALDRHKARR